LANRRFLPSGGILGVPCAHLYTAASGGRAFTGPLSDKRASALKGRDRLVARAAQRAGLSARLSPYLFETCADESWRLTRPPTDRERTIFRQRRLGATELEAGMPVEHHAGWDMDDDVTWVLPPPWGSLEEPDPWRDAEPASDLLGELEYSATDYFGNEGSDAAFYVSAALLLDVPPVRKRTVTTAPRRSAARKAAPVKLRRPRLPKR
jgi:hypothetical protein